MKRYPLFLLLALISISVFGQEAYYVIHSQGQVKTVGGQFLTPRSKLSPDDELTFSSDKAFLVVFSSTSGRKVIRPVKSAETGSAVSYFVKENLLPVSTALNSRGENKLRSFNEIKEYFSVPVLILSSHQFEVDESGLGINEERFLVLSQQSGDEEIVRKIASENGIVSLNADLVENSELPTELKLKDESFGSVMSICPVELIIKDKESLSAEIDVYEELSGEKLTKETLSKYLAEIYGRISDNEAAELLK
jgi:hypothetical protein